MSAPPLVSVVVPTHDRGMLVAECLASLAAAEYPQDRYEVIVVGAACADDTRELVARAAAGSRSPSVRWIETASRDANAARNAGIGAASGDLIALLDDDVLVPPEWLRELAAGAERHPGADCLGGPIRPRFEGEPPRTCPRHELPGLTFDEGDDEHDVAEVWGCNMAVRRAAVARVGPLLPGLRVQQEWEWQQRLLAGGGRIVYLPTAWVWHRRREADLRLRGLVREFFTRGYTKAALGQPVAVRLVAPRALRRLRHWARTRCNRGLVEAARDLGLLGGALVGRRTRQAGANARTRAATASASAAGSPAIATVSPAPAGAAASDASTTMSAQSAWSSSAPTKSTTPSSPS
jgi:GT2 family glycosyltransferase